MMWTRRTSRRGSALILVLLLTVTLAAIALSAILLTGSSTILTHSFDRERDYRYAAEAGLAMGKSSLTKDTTINLPDSGYVTLISNGTITGADGKVVPNLHVNVYAGMSGNVTGEFGKYASIVSEAYDSSGTRYVRRLELAAENFARYAMFTNTFPAGLCYSTGEFIRGRAHSNQGWYSCNSPTYYDTVSAVGSISGGSPTFEKGKISGAPVIPIPPVSKLAVLQTNAAAANLDITTLGTNLSNVRTRIEFVAVDLNNDGDVNDNNEGFFRVYQGNSAYDDRVRVDPTPHSSPSQNMPPDSLCGDWHLETGSDGVQRLNFFPTFVHGETWFKNKITAGTIVASSPTDVVASAGSVTANERDRIMAHSGFRCYPGGDPHLVASERRNAIPAVSASKWQKGGDDTTFTDSTIYGYWQKWGGDNSAVITAFAAIPAATPYVGYQHQANNARLWPLDRTLNPGSKGVIHTNGPVALSGVLRGWVTLYAQTSGSAKGTVLLIDDLVYAQDPASVLCANLFGLIADTSIMIADNAINSPQRAGKSGAAYRWTDGNDNGMLTANNFVFHGVTMSRTGTVGVENFNSHPEGSSSFGNCNTAHTGRGCIQQAGGVIENFISATYSANYDGFGENRSVDQCLNIQSPPYFPTTGHYINNRFSEIDPARFDVATLFSKLQSGE
ncbi:MAG: hypothetical protein ACREND_12855, partial [Gemmatimonadaceae bacterium]